eukprot:4145781-Amphidinium_carterae.2
MSGMSAGKRGIVAAVPTVVGQSKGLKVAAGWCAVPIAMVATYSRAVATISLGTRRRSTLPQRPCQIMPGCPPNLSKAFRWMFEEGNRQSTRKKKQTESHHTSYTS